jgi:nucleotide-binding universal stress UspA family protein
MTTEEQRVTDQPVSRSGIASTLKTILLYVQDDESVGSRIEAGLTLARASSAHLSCLHVTPIQAYVAFDKFGGIFVMNDVIKSIDERAAELQTRVQDELRSEDVTWDYEHYTGDIATSIVSRAALADLVVVGRDPHREDFGGSATGLLGDLLYRLRSPIYIPGDGASPVDPTGMALVAWDGTYEAANAVRSSIGLLKLASSVRVVRVAEAKDEGFPNTKVLKYLSRQGIEAEFVDERPPSMSGNDDVISAALVAHARASNASYLVMGGYSQSRISQFVFGGVTSTLLKSCPVPLVIAH